MTKKVLFINHEMTPYVPETEKSILGRELPQLVQDIGFEVRTFMPKWGNINERRGQLHPVQRLSGMNIIIDETDQPLIIKVASIPQSRIQVYFIDNEDYFNRFNTTGKEAELQGDNGERAVFFARGVLDAVKKQRWVPDVIHCQGWISAVVPFYIKTAYKDEPAFANTKVITSLFESNLRKSLGKKFKKSLPYRNAGIELLNAYNSRFNFAELGKLAIDYSDVVVAATPKVDKKLVEYAEQSKTTFVPYPGEDSKNVYSALYQQLTGEE